MSYTAKILQQQTVYIDNETGNPCSPSETERLLDSINGSNKYTFCMLYSCIGEIRGKTKKSLNEQAYKFAEENKLYDFELFIK